MSRVLEYFSIKPAPISLAISATLPCEDCRMMGICGMSSLM